MLGGEVVEGGWAAAHSVGGGHRHRVGAGELQVTLPAAVVHCIEDRFSHSSTCETPPRCVPADHWAPHWPWSPAARAPSRGSPPW